MTNTETAKTYTDEDRATNSLFVQPEELDDPSLGIKRYRGMFWSENTELGLFESREAIDDYLSSKTYSV